MMTTLSLHTPMVEQAQVPMSLRESESQVPAAQAAGREA